MSNKQTSFQANQIAMKPTGVKEEKVEALKQETLRRWQEEAELNDTVLHANVMMWLDTWGEEHSDKS